MPRLIARFLPLLLLVVLFNPASAQQPSPAPNLKLGDLVVTGFSGTTQLGSNKPAADLTFINPDGPSARIVDVSKPGYVWDGRLLQAPKTFDVFAKDVGQVFGVALDDSAQPNIYVAATSAFGLNIVSRGRDGSPQRRKKGGPGAGWMKGQFGLDLQGGPGGIYKIDGRTGVVTLFANVTLDGVPNPGPGLGNLAYDSAHKQLFVSDLYTGMIHRFDLDGKELGRYDHGVTGLGAAKLATVPFNPKNRPNIASDNFDSGQPDTWGFAPAARRVWGLAVHEDRLYYSVLAGPQIWSVGIARDGNFSNDPRWELDVPAQTGPLPVSDIAFSHEGAIILAQRAVIAGSYDYSAFTRPGEPQVLRISLKGPNDPPSPGRWKLAPDEYAIGFAGNDRNSNGGVALGYGYNQDGTLSTSVCEAALWTTGQNLRNNPALRSQLEPGGPLVVHGLQGSPADMVRNANTPPTVSYFVDYDDKFDDPRATGHIGSVRIYTTPCAPAAYARPVAVTPIATPISKRPQACTPTCVCPPGTELEGRECVKIKDCPAPQILDPVTGTCKCPPRTAMVNGKCVPVIFSQGNKCTPPMIQSQGGPCVCPPDMTMVDGKCVPKTTTCQPPQVLDPITGLCACPQGTVLQGRKCVPQVCPAPLVPGPCKCPDGTHQKDGECVKETPVDLGIQKTGGTTPYCPAPYYDFNLTVTNVGNGWLGTGNITVTDTVPANMTFGPITAPGWSCPSGIIPGGTTFTCTYTGPAPTAGQVLPAIGIPATATVGPPFPPYTNCAGVAITPSSGYVDSNAGNNNACVTVAKPSSCNACPPPQVMNVDNICVCPPPMVTGATPDTCVCPQGTTLVNGACVPVNSCQPPQVMIPRVGCGCPNGGVLEDGKCVPADSCKPPQVMIPGVGCRCPDNEVLVDGKCVRKIVCDPPLVPNADGTKCGCQAGEILSDGKCVKISKRTQPKSCKRGFVWNGDMCVKRKTEPKDQKSRELPNIRIPLGIPGLGGRGNGGGGRGTGGGGAVR